jgi:tetratricopeptide (TPR) repeat protein
MEISALSGGPWCDLGSRLWRLAARMVGVALIAVLAGCAGRPHEAATPGAAASRGTALNLADQRLMRLIEAEQRLAALVAEGYTSETEIQRRFQQLARDYAALIADNPTTIEPRLLYGKLLTHYGDCEGAKVVFHITARMDPTIAVSYQQLATCYAEEGDYARAMVYALEAIERAPHEAAYHYGLGELLHAFRDRLVSEGEFGAGQLDRQMLTAFANAARLSSEPALHFRYGETFHDVAEPDWQAAADHWRAVLAMPRLTALQGQAARLHLARVLLLLDAPADVAELLAPVDNPALAATRAELLAAATAALAGAATPTTDHL